MSFRGVAACLLVLTFALAAFPTIVSAQQKAAAAPPPPSELEMEDKTGDVSLNVATRAGVPPQSGSSSPINTDHLDITKVVFGDETEKEFKVSLYLKALNPTQSTPVPLGFATRAVTWAYGKVDWQVRVGACQGNNGQAPATNSGCLGFRDGGARDFRSVLTVPAEAADGAYTFTIPKDAIFNEQRVPGRYGAELYNVSARTSQYFGGLFFFPGGSGDPTGGITASDRAPDEGVVDKVFQFVQGSGSKGHLSLAAKEPIRVSNGEATTIVYRVDLFNDAEKKIKVQLDVAGLRPDWAVRVPSLLTVEPATSITFPVILALPFTHEHGKTVTFTVHASDVEDENAMAMVDLGVFWTDVPQPSAHHNGELWFHSAPADSQGPVDLPQVATFTTGWINSIADDPDPEATDANVGGFAGNNGFSCFFAQGGPTNCGVPPTQRVVWQFPLSPKLLIGLDFDTTQQGKVVANILPKVPATLATLSASLLYCDPSKMTSNNPNQGGLGRGGSGNMTCNRYETLLASGKANNALSANAPAHFEIPLDIDPKADYLPYQNGANIALRFELVTDTPQTLIGTEPRPEFVTKDGHVNLPLIEYHDPVDAAFENVGSLKLEALSGFEKKVNAGRTTKFTFNLTNEGKSDQHIAVEVQGVNAEWAVLETASDFHLVAGGTNTISVAVTAPADAVKDERAELFIVAHNPDDESIVTVSRMRATVVEEEIPDEAAALAVKEDTPGLGLVGLLSALGVAAIVLRRRA